MRTKKRKLKLTLLSKILITIIVISIMLLFENSITKDINKCIEQGNTPNYCFKQLHG